MFLIALAVRFYLSRYNMLLNDHGFMVGIDYVDQNIGLPLQWVLIVSLPAGRRRFSDPDSRPGRWSWWRR